MKNEEEIKKAMESIKVQLTRSTGEGTAMLQGQYAALEWVTEEKKENEDEQ